MSELATRDVGWSPYSATVRLAAGTIGFLLEQLQRIEGEVVNRDVVLEAPALDSDWGSVGALLIGFVADLPDRLARSAEAIDRASSPLRSTLAPVGRAVRATPAGSIVVELRRALHAEGERLAAIGRSEYLRGRVVAASAYAQALDAVAEYLDEEAASDRVQDRAVAGAPGTRDVRGPGSGSDGFTEAVRRLFRRERQAVPSEPQPSRE